MFQTSAEQLLRHIIFTTLKIMKNTNIHKGTVDKSQKKLIQTMPFDIKLIFFSIVFFLSYTGY